MSRSDALGRERADHDSPREACDSLSDEQEQRLSALVWDFLERLRQGDEPDPCAIILANPDIAVELERRLSAAEVLQNLGQSVAPSGGDLTLLQNGVSLGGISGEPPMDSLVPGRLGHYELCERLGQGSSSVVYRALDTRVNREVALKRIQERRADDPQSQARFLHEAEVTGSLEHRGIVPVYAIGHFENGRPFYAMRFIKGDSLKGAADRFHADASLRKDPGRRALELLKLLRRFTDVCNAISYAHARGVLHRDIKPGNVILGRYGETLVVDWGLAKATGRPDPGADSGRRVRLDRILLRARSKRAAAERFETPGLGPGEVVLQRTNHRIINPRACRSHFIRRIVRETPSRIHAR